MENPSSDDIFNFKAAMDWTYEQIKDEHLEDDIRVWVDIYAI